MTIAWLVLISAGAFGGLATLLIARRLQLGRDFFFIVVTSEALIYLHLAPLFWYRHVALTLKPVYVQLSIECLILFEIPLVLSYLWTIHRGPLVNPAGIGSAIVTKRNSAIVLGSLAAAFAAIFLVVTVRYHLLFLRLGALGEANALVNLPYAAYASFRLFGLGALGMILILTTAASLATARWDRHRLAACAALVFLVYIAQRALNSRLDVIMAFTLVFGAIVTINPGFRVPTRLALWGVAVVLLAGYGLRVAVNARDYYVGHGGLSWQALDPFRNGSGGSDAAGNLGLRLNGIDLLAQITPAARARGYAWGEAWRIPAIVVWNQIRLRREANQRYLYSYLATPKRYLILAYTTIDSPDYPSCMLADAYGNFGPMGLVLVGVVLGAALGACARALRQQRSSYAMVVALFLLQGFLVFESDFWSILTGWVRIAPVMLVFLVFAPFGKPTAAEWGDRNAGNDSWSPGRAGVALGLPGGK